MPIPPPTLAAPFETFNYALNLARVRLNDAIASAGGDILTNTQPFTQTSVWAAFRKLQAYLANLGQSQFKKQIILSGYPVCGSTDPASMAYLDWTTYFDGAEFFVPPQVPVLPQDFILPLWVKERIAGNNCQFQPMANALDDLPGCYKTGWNRFWQWNDNKIFMPGSQSVMDLQIRYAAYMADPITVGDPTVDGVYWYNQPVPIMRSSSSLANYIAAEVAAPRDDVDAQMFKTEAENDAKLIFNFEVAQKQRVTATRRPYGRGNYQNQNYCY